MKMVIIKDFDAPRNCVNCQNEGLSEIVGCGLFDECGKHPDCPFIEVKEGACPLDKVKQVREEIESIGMGSYLEFTKEIACNDREVRMSKKFATAVLDKLIAEN